MGVVYRAEDIRLKRPVALKFLSQALVRDEDAKRRFIREARAASSLDHPNLCTIYEIDEGPDGQLFLAMAFYEGETLKARIARGPVPVDEAVDYVIQVAQGLRKAHEAGIVHRDIKPSNLFVTRDGIVKILDFGLAKQDDQTELTRTGTTPGTVAYMAPEQVRDGETDQRTDLWALGAVLYELLTGRSAFAGENVVAVMHAVLNVEPRLPGDLQSAEPGLGKVLARVLAKDSTSRYASAGELLHDLSELRSRPDESHSSKTAPRPKRLLQRPAFAISAAVIVLVVLGIAGWAWTRSSGARWARNQAIPEVDRLVSEGSYPEAFQLAQEASSYVPDDPLLRRLRPEFANTFSVQSTPPGAAVSVRPYETSGEWQSLGDTPLINVQLPRQVLRWRIQSDGFEPAEFVTREQETGPVAEHKVELQRVGEHPPEMVFIPAGGTARTFGVQLNVADVPPFFLDRYEVTNKEFKEFVDSGGYERASYWEGLDFTRDGKRLSWTDARKYFVDSTRMPGPATWELGDYPDGQADYPITGVSWYEAMAFARFRGKALPTVYHWAKAAVPDNEAMNSLTAAIVPLSNFGGRGAAPVGRHLGISPFGAYDMHGNVREWVWNSGPAGAWALGGSWNEASYYYRNPSPVSPFDRSPVNGFRLMKEIPQYTIAARFFEPVNLVPAELPNEKPASDEVFEAYRQQFAYSSGDLKASQPVTLETTEDWSKEVVTLDTGYGETVQLFLFFPKRIKPPLQSVVYFPGIDVFQVRSSSREIQPGFAGMPLDHVVKSGRVLIQPIYKGSYERWVQPPRLFSTQIFVNWRWDIGRTLDYIESRPEFDSRKIAYVGLSYGASYALPMLALERRFQGALLLSGGMPATRMPAPAEAIHYLSRITLPVLMLNGRYDDIVPQARQLAVFNQLGTPAALKRRVVFEAGHAFLPRKEYLNQSLAWLDATLGKVNR